jgi:hypothetical protein
MYSAADLLNGGVSPFGHPRINDRSHLPAAFRSVPRPSSPLGAKASTERPCLTHHPVTTTPARSTKPRNKPMTHRQQALRLPTTLPFPDSPVKDRPRREQVSTEGVSWKRPGWGPKSRPRLPMSSRPEAALQDIERGERSQMIWQVVIFQEGRNQRTSALSVTHYP